VITLEGASSPEVEATLERLATEDVLGQLLRREGRMATLGTEGGDVKLDWVDGVQWALDHPQALQAAAEEGAATLRQGIRHVIWSGMGGSVQTVYTLKRMGYLDAPGLSVHPLDSTDPAALNRILAAIGAPGGRGLRAALQETMMLGVSMGMTSEEPITHLEWFDGLLRQEGLPDPGRQIQVMTLPDSYLDQFARARGSRTAPIQLDGENHTPGRMSAPATRVFLRPVALMLAAHGAPGALPAVLRRGQDLYRLRHGLPDTTRRALTRDDPFLRLAAWLALRAGAGPGPGGGGTGPGAGWGAPKLLVTLPPGWEGFAPWLEQLVEESLGKGGKGFLVFYDQSPAGRYGPDCAVLRIAVEGYGAPPEGPPGLPVLTLRVPAAPAPAGGAEGSAGGAVGGRGGGGGGEGDPVALPPAAAGLGELAGLFLGFKKTVAGYGYLQDIVYAGQPAVEAYKKYARDLREAPGPVRLDAGASGRSGGRWRVVSGPLALDYSSLAGILTEDEMRRLAERVGQDEDMNDAGVVFGAILSAARRAGSGVGGLKPARRAGSLRYLDLTWNGELPPMVRGVLEGAREMLANECLGIPAKLRTGPSDYHSTEQGETDGPPELVSLRLVAERHEAVQAGAYDDTFLLAQARGTWQAMEDAGRWIVFVTLPETGDTPAGASAAGALSVFFDHAAVAVQEGD
jgi:hypothetical protein